MDNTTHSTAMRVLSCMPETLALLFDHMQQGILCRRFRLGLIGSSTMDTVRESTDPIGCMIADIDQAPQDLRTTALSEETRRLAARKQLNASMRPILLALAQAAGMDLAAWRPRIESSRPLTDDALLQALPEVFSSEAFREARRACRDLTLLPPELRVFAAEPFDLGFRGRPPAKILAQHPCWDIPFVPGAHALIQWTIRDAADWMMSWPPEPGELKEPMDEWDTYIADLWLRRIPLPEELKADQTNPIVVYREGRTTRSPTEVIAGLDGDNLLVLTDAVLCERLRREVMAVRLQDRADLIHLGLEMVACGYLYLDDVRAALALHDDAREESFRQAFAETDDWTGEWAVDWSWVLICGYDWPLQNPYP